MHGHGGSWYKLDQLCSSNMQGWVVAVVKEDLSAKNPGFGRLRQSRRFGLVPDVRSIDTHLQFLCIPHSHSSTPRKCVIFPSAFFTLLLSLHVPSYTPPLIPSLILSFYTGVLIFACLHPT